MAIPASLKTSCPASLETSCIVSLLERPDLSEILDPNRFLLPENLRKKTKKICKVFQSERRFLQLIEKSPKLALSLLKIQNPKSSRKLNVGATGRLGQTVLHYAASSRNLELVELLIKKYNLDVYAKDQCNRTILHNAARSGNLKLVQFLLANYPSFDITKKTIFDESLLELATMSGNLELVQYLVEVHHFDPRTMNTVIGIDSLYVAAEHGHIEIVKYFIEKFDINENHLYQNGYTVLSLAAFSGNVELVKYLVDKWKLVGKIDLVCREHEVISPLLTAAKSGSLELVQYLKEICGATDIVCYPSTAENLLLCAASSGNTALVKHIVETYNYDITYTDENDNSVLHMAAQSGNIDLMKYLFIKFLERNLYLPVKDLNLWGQSIIYIAFEQGKIELVKYLVETLKIDPNLKKEDCKKLIINMKLSHLRYLIESCHFDIKSFSQEEQLDILSLIDDSIIREYLTSIWRT